MALSLKALSLKNSPAVLCRSFHLSSKAMDKSESPNAFMFRLEGYNKYGLLRDDLILGDWNKDVEEALRRLPEEKRLQRIYRAIRAQQAEINHDILPKEEWTKVEDDHYYLQPYLKEVIREREEREEWEANH